MKIAKCLHDHFAFSISHFPFLPAVFGPHFQERFFARIAELEAELVLQTCG